MKSPRHDENCNVQSGTQYHCDCGLDGYRDALEIFQNRRKLARSLRAESPQVAAFVEAIGVNIDKALLTGDDNAG